MIINYGSHAILIPKGKNCDVRRDNGYSLFYPELKKRSSCTISFEERNTLVGCKNDIRMNFFLQLQVEAMSLCKLQDVRIEFNNSIFFYLLLLKGS